MKKILKNLLIIGCFCFLFFVSNVKAQTGLLSNYSSQVKYTDEFIDIVNSNSARLDSLHTYLSNIRYFDYSYVHIDLQQEKYILRIDNINTNTWRVGIIYFDTFNFRNEFRDNSGYLNFGYRMVTLDVIFNNDNASSHTIYSYGSDSVYYNYSSILNPNNSDVIFEENSTYYDTYYMGDSVNVLFQENTSSGYYNVPIYTDTNDTTYYPNDNVNMKAFFDSFMPYGVDPLVCTKNQVLGFLSNVSDFTFRIKGKSNALDYPIRGQLQFNYPSDITITNSDLSIEIVQFNDEEVMGNYKLNCPSDIKSCYIEYSYNYIDDITTIVDFGIKVTFNTNNLPLYIQLYNCFHNDMYDYYNTSYTYTNSSNSSSNNDSIISNFLQDGSQPDLDGLVDTSLIGDGPVDSILLLPLNIMNTLLNVLNSSTCQPLVVPLPFVNRDMTLPCISTIYSQINGLSLFLNWFSAIMSAFILYEYFIRLYKWVDDTLTFRENNHFGGF